MQSKFLLVLLTTLLFGCANPINRVTYQKYYDWGVTAELNGNNELARENYWRAYVNTQIGNLEPEREAASAYSLGRMLGITCQAEKAEEFLLHAVEKDQESNGPVYMSYNELARLNFDQEKFTNAVEYFDKSIPMIDKSDFIEADPIGVALLFEEYATALEETDRGEEAKIFRQRATEIRSKTTSSEILAERTPYMSKCIPLKN